jgi:hypothetical protein
MKPPFSAEQFLEVFKNYNQSVFPMQILFYLIGIIAIYLVIKPNANPNKIIGSILAFFWLWMGVVYHLIYFTDINQLAYLFGAFFIVQGILFVVLGVFQDLFSFQFKKDMYGITGIILIVFALIIYPISGYLLGHVYPSSPTFGLPCPTTIFTFGLLLLNQKKCPIAILIIPFIWSIIGFMAAFQFGISLLIYRNRKLKKM